jgi:hypothetical protein
MDYEVLKKIIECGLQAPTADNGQPWKIKLITNGFVLYLDISPNNTNYYLGIMSVGAFIKNVEIASQHLGFKVFYSLFPENDKSAVVSFTFDKQGGEPKELFDAIYTRCTNRKPYAAYKVTIYEKNFLSESQTDDVKLLTTEDSKQIKDLAKVASLHQFLSLTNSILHKFLFSHIIWSKKIESGNYGMYIKTFELNPVQQFIFKFCSNWFVLSLLNKLGFSKLVAKSNEDVFAHSSGIGVLIVPNPLSVNKYLVTGQVMQDLWLRMAKLGLSMQPLVGVVYLNQQTDLYPQAKELNSTQKELIKNAYKVIQNAFGLLENQKAIFMFRYGKSDGPSAVSPKKNLEEVLI